MSPKGSSKKVLPWQQQKIHTQNFTFKQIPLYFQEKSPNLVELTILLLSYGQKMSRVVLNTSGQHGVKMGVTVTLPELSEWTSMFDQE